MSRTGTDMAAGFAIDMITSNLSDNNLSPLCIEFPTRNAISILNEYVFTFCNSGIPLLLGVEVTGKENKVKGNHAVTILGFDNTNVSEYKDISALYLHDDRYGPFAKANISNQKLEIQLNNINIEDKEFYIPKYPFSGRFSKEYKQVEKKLYIQNVIDLKLKVLFPDEIFEITDKI